ncbi:hypothetical protein KY320_01445 [Candidatus Woesearchaeota archaeon]|nr:hypothetical protein [Candidatus Woesearchaeota archaeon]
MKNVVAYCVKCKQKRAMVGAVPKKMKNGADAMTGKCQVCGTKMFRIGKV